MRMLYRLTIHLSLMLLFALTQIDIVTHEIEHFTESQQHQEEQHNHSGQCEQCLSYSHADVTGLAPTFTFESNPADRIFATSDFTSGFSAPCFFYSARAPPISQT
jgi:hypothetical protein